MIQDATVFDDEHLPREIVGRNRHMNEVTDALAPIQKGQRAENCFLFGPSGAGKTTVARAALRELNQRLLDVPSAYVNCWFDYTRTAVLERTAKDLAGAPITRGSSARETLDKIRHNLSTPSVLILDEFDQVQDSNVLYDLHSVNGLSWIVIANREIDVLSRLDDRVRSRMGIGYRVEFSKYSVDTVAGILDRRARHGLTKNAVSERVLRLIAEHSDGDARTAIFSLKTAARRAEKEGLTSIPARIVKSAVLEAESEVRQKNISKLNDHQRVIYEIVRDESPLIQKEVYERYEAGHPDSVSYKTFRTSYLPKLEHYHLIQSTSEAGAKKFDIVE